ncbi:hypothetical protein GCM10007897_45060 [Sphingobium jiangsuense]|uniref:Na+-translocating ferredoxin:NAD+ oxidoreductase RnfC subunit n=1 Tax=Sphingobium jiangsuense TaxID=870476 RepID=A0A7W6BM92_9SPHN|nr:hypothetical protein [Sphingobium jiangsuense]MBB3926197.1 Na+-translocating ferredoxin:NAD+ oxidoreductase RnfC subunit [Sphingobium jiangsuense]GLT03063.1 hypothetical protein GCM10007897_45060 [Sphingobium jiangsuense]
MTDDLKARLREIAREHGVAGFGRSHAILEAADRIEALEAAVTLALPVIERELFVMLDSCCAKDDAGRLIRSTLEYPSDDVTQMEAAIAACRNALAGGGDE